ncbi:MAG: sulfate adenylyltransferase subunit CysD [Hyphomicrobiales bacterium]|nr:sulfate adenylyltransferase subunit CysD [Hyphomicrobiales bacterium]
MNHLDKLEAQSIFIFREAFNKIDKMAMLWSFGKDSNVMIHLARKAFFGRIPFPLIHVDTELEMDEVYAFRDQYVKEWGIHFVSEVCPPIEETDDSLPWAARVAARKTLGLKNVISKNGYTGIVAGIRRDEEGTRAKERYFSPRNKESQWDVKDQPPEFWDQFMTDFEPGTHVRIHPLLHWTEFDVWNYIKRENIPVVPLYFAREYGEFEGRDFGGKLMRFRSLGEKGITWPLESAAATIDEIIEELRTTKISERSGRPMGADEDESSFERLRADGYM